MYIYIMFFKRNYDPQQRLCNRFFFLNIYIYICCFFGCWRGDRKAWFFRGRQAQAARFRLFVAVFRLFVAVARFSSVVLPALLSTL